MNRYVLFLLLAGCAQQDRPAGAAPPKTEDRPITLTCEPFTADIAKLRRVTKSRDDWKRYAESLEGLPSTVPSNPPPSNEP